MKSIVVGVSGASGIILAKRTISALIAAGYCVDLVISKAALYVATLEMDGKFNSSESFREIFNELERPLIHCHSIHDIGASICSGTYRTAGMVIVPCSMASIAAISMGLSDNCLRRAADVTLKERRPMTLVFREAPLSQLHLEHLLKLSQLGATILPPVPAWYVKPQSIEQIENFIVGKILDSFSIPHTLYHPWSGSC